MDRLIKDRRSVLIYVCGTAKVTRQGSMFGIDLLEARQESSKHILFPMIFALEYICNNIHTWYKLLSSFKLVSSLDVSCSTPRQDIPYAYQLGVHYVQIPHCRPIYMTLCRFGDINNVCLRKWMQHGCSFRGPQ